MDNFWKAIDAIQVGLIGALGAACVALLRRSKMTWVDAGIYIFVGGCAAQFIPPIIVSYFSFLDNSHLSGIGFITGSVAGYVGLWAIRFVFDGELSALIKSRFGGGQ